MAIEAYRTSVVRLGERELPEVLVVTLRTGEDLTVTGSMTGAIPRDLPDTPGDLTFTGLREVGQVHVTAADIEILDRSAVGCRFAVRGQIERAIRNEPPASL